VVVDARLNRRLTAPFRIEPSAEVTVLTRSTAEALGLVALEEMPRHPVTTPGGMVTLPITSVRWVSVGRAEVRDVTVAIDDGRLAVGWLGQSFLRRVQATADPHTGTVTFAR
jgi:predicted aspartyl protease